MNQVLAWLVLLVGVHTIAAGPATQPAQTCAGKPWDAAGLTAEAVQTALAQYFSAPKHEGALISRSIFTPGQRHRVGATDFAVTSRAEIPQGKEVALVRVEEVAIRDIDAVPAQVTVVVKLVAWHETGGSKAIAMHAFPTYEMTLNREGQLTVTKETLLLE